jgi:hypothetical protein
VKSGLKALERLRGSVHEGLDRTAVAYVVLGVALLLTGLAFLYVRHNVEAREHERFEEITLSTERAVDRRMQTYIDAMLDGRGLFAASVSPSRRGRPTSDASAARAFLPTPCGPPESATSTSRSSTSRPQRGTTGRCSATTSTPAG